jgi:hypothetical protein
MLYILIIDSNLQVCCSYKKIVFHFVVGLSFLHDFFFLLFLGPILQFWLKFVFHKFMFQILVMVCIYSNFDCNFWLCDVFIFFNVFFMSFMFFIILVWNFLTLTLYRFVFYNGLYLIWCNKSPWHNIVIRVAMKDVPYIPPNTFNRSNYFYIFTKSYYNFSCCPSTFVECCLMLSWYPLSSS